MVRGDISSTRNTGGNEVTVELYELTREELFWSEIIDEEYYSVTPETVEDFINHTVRGLM